MSSLPAVLRQLVLHRAQNACEYCGLSQEGQEATFHIDHIVPRLSGGETVAENLALAACLARYAKLHARLPSTRSAVLR